MKNRLHFQLPKPILIVLPPLLLGLSLPLSATFHILPSAQAKTQTLETKVSSATAAVPGLEFTLEAITFPSHKPPLKSALPCKLPSDNPDSMLLNGIKKQEATETIKPAIHQDYQLKILPPWLPKRHQVWVQGAPSATVTISRLEPADWIYFGFSNNKPIGQLLTTKNYSISKSGTLIDLDLKPFLQNNTGQFLISTTLNALNLPGDCQRSCWIQVTDIGLDAYNGQELLVQASNLSNGKAIKNLTLELSPYQEKISTNEAGEAIFSLTSRKPERQMLIARSGKDLCILPVAENANIWNSRKLKPKFKCWAVSNRKIYSPKEEATVKGWLRFQDFADDGTTKLSLPNEAYLNYYLLDSKKNLLWQGSSLIDKNGGFDFKVAIPENAAQGTATIYLKPSTTSLEEGKPKSINPTTDPRLFEPADNSDLNLLLPPMPKKNDWEVGSQILSIEIQELRQTELSVKTSSSQGSSLILGEETILSANTNYINGSPLKNAPITWSVQAQADFFSPPGWPEYNFTPKAYGSLAPYLFQESACKWLEGITDADGKNSVKLSFKEIPATLPIAYSCQAIIQDTNSRQWTDSINILVHPSEIYAGIKTNKVRYRCSEPLNISLIATDIKGKYQPGTKIELTIAEALPSGKVRHSKKQLVLGNKPLELKLPAINQVCELSLTATVYDAQHRRNLAQWTGSIYNTKRESWARVKEQTVVLSPNANTYKPGNLAEITITSPFYPAKGELFLLRHKVLATIPLHFESLSSKLTIPLTQAHIPALRLSACLTGPKGQFATGTIQLNIPPEQNSLKLSIQPESQEIIAGEETTLNLSLKDFQGKPVSDGQIALVVIDEATPAQTNYIWPKPASLFFDSSTLPLAVSRSRDYLMQANQTSKNIAPATNSDNACALPPEHGPRELAVTQAKSNNLEEANDPLKSISQSNFSNTSSAPLLFNTNLSTDNEGKARVRFQLPRRAARYRIMAAAVAGVDRFGDCEASLDVTQETKIKH